MLRQSPWKCCSTAGATGQHPVVSSCKQSWFIPKEMGALESGSSPAPLTGALWLFGQSGSTIPALRPPPSDTDQPGCTPSLCCGDRDGWDVLPRAHLHPPGQPQAAVNYSHWEPAQEAATKDPCSHLYTLNTNRNHTDGEYFTLSNHFLCDPASRALRNLPWQAELS